jgi:hypothetical protein
MKRMNLKLMLLLAAGSMLFTSCYKKFDAKTYAPKLEIGGYSSSSEISPANLVGYWPFDGDLVDKVSNAAAVNTGTTFANGFKGQALQGAINAYVLATPGAAIASLHSFTITFWVNSPAPSTGIIAPFNIARTDNFWGNISIFFENGSSNSNGKFRANVNNGTTDTWVSKDGIQNLFDKWTSLSLTYDAATSTFAVYVNGSSVATSTVANFGSLAFGNVGKIVFGCPQFQTTPSQTSGATSQGWASFLTGRLDEVRIYNKALSPAEISALTTLEGRGK